MDLPGSIVPGVYSRPRGVNTITNYAQAVESIDEGFLVKARLDSAALNANPDGIRF